MMEVTIQYTDSICGTYFYSYQRDIVVDEFNICGSEHHAL